MTSLHRTADDPGAICPCCRQRWPDEDGDLERLLRKNVGRVSLIEIARAAGVSLSRLVKVAAQSRPPIEVNAPADREPEPRGA